MKETKILDRDEKILRETAKSIPIKDISSKKIKSVLERMENALNGEADGVAIAAPQIGESLRIFLVREGISDKKVFINPEVTKRSRKKRSVEEGCLSVRWLYGEVNRSEKVTVKAYDENGKKFERGASGLLAQIFEHETDHLDGTLFIDKAKNLRDAPPLPEIRYVFFGSSEFSKYVLDELKDAGLSPVLEVASARDHLDLKKLSRLNADVFIVASFGKILSKEILEIPRHGVLNVHPSLLPKLRGASPIQNLILQDETPGVTIIKMDEKMDHGPILAQAKVPVEPWPDHYSIVEEKLGRAGGILLSAVLPKWVNGEVLGKEQDEHKATLTKLIKKEDGLLDMNDSPEVNLRKVLAYSTWPGAHMIYKNKFGKDIRLVVKDAEIKDSIFVPTRITPAGKREMAWEEFLRGN